MFLTIFKGLGLPLLWETLSSVYMKSLPFVWTLCFPLRFLHRFQANLANSKSDISSIDFGEEICRKDFCIYNRNEKRIRAIRRRNVFSVWKWFEQKIGNQANTFLPKRKLVRFFAPPPPKNTEMIIKIWNGELLSFC